MYATQHKCDECGSTIYLTRLNKRLFCKKCWEYKSEFSHGRDITMFDIRRALQIVRGDNKYNWIGGIA